MKRILTFVILILGLFKMGHAQQRSKINLFQKNEKSSLSHLGAITFVPVTKPVLTPASVQSMSLMTSTRLILYQQPQFVYAHKDPILQSSANLFRIFGKIR